jgi:hypothetical protein
MARAGFGPVNAIYAICWAGLEPTLINEFTYQAPIGKNHSGIIHPGLQAALIRISGMVSLRWLGLLL